MRMQAILDSLFVRPGSAPIGGGGGWGRKERSGTGLLLHVTIFTFAWSLLLLEGFAPSLKFKFQQNHSGMNGKYDFLLLIMNTCISF